MTLDPAEYRYSWGGTGYQLLFEGIISSALARYGFLDCVFIAQDEKVRVYWSKAVTSHAAAYGRQLFSDMSAAKAFSAKLEEFASHAALPIDVFDKAVFLERLAGLEAYLHAYMSLDPEFTDAVLASAESDLVEYLGTLKNSSRETINRLFFSDDGVYEQLIEQTAQALGVQSETVRNTRLEDVIARFDSDVTLSHRGNYTIRVLNDSIEYIFGDQAEVLGRTFIEHFESGASTGVIKGQPVGKRGIYRGRVKKISVNHTRMQEAIEEYNALEGDIVLVADNTIPELLPIMRKSIAVVTDMGGMLSHAAITAREFNIACIIGTGNATAALNDGDMVEVDSDKGEVQKV